MAGYGARFDKDRTFGVEIECYMPDGMTSTTDLARALSRRTGLPVRTARYSDNDTSCWRIKTDGSLHGMNGAEAVSPILAGEPGLEQVRIIAEAMDEIGCRVNRECGLHVHHSVSDYTVKDWKKLAQLYVKMEGAIDLIMPPSRRSSNSRWCGTSRWDGHDESAIKARMADIARADTKEQVVSRLARHGRYYKLNPHTGPRGTAEFRQHSGTVNSEKIVNWVLLTHCMVDLSKRATHWTDRGIDSVDILMKMCIDKAMKKYFRRRIKELN